MTIARLKSFLTQHGIKDDCKMVVVQVENDDYKNKKKLEIQTITTVEDPAVHELLIYTKPNNE